MSRIYKKTGGKYLEKDQGERLAIELSETEKANRTGPCSEAGLG